MNTKQWVNGIIVSRRDRVTQFTTFCWQLTVFFFPIIMHLTSNDGQVTVATTAMAWIRWQANKPDLSLLVFQSLNVTAPTSSWTRCQTTTKTTRKADGKNEHSGRFWSEEEWKVMGRSYWSRLTNLGWFPSGTVAGATSGLIPLAAVQLVRLNGTTHQTLHFALKCNNSWGPE